MKINLLLLISLFPILVFSQTTQTTLYQNTFTSSSSDSIFSNPYNFYIIDSGIDSSFDNSSFLIFYDVDNIFEVNLLNEWSNYDSVFLTFNAKWDSYYQYGLEISDKSFNTIKTDTVSTFGSLTPESIYSLNITNYLNSEKLSFLFVKEYVPEEGKRKGYLLLDNLTINGFSSITSINTAENSNNTKEPTKYLNTQGIEIKKENLQPNVFYISIYEDGHKEKFVIVE